MAMKKQYRTSRGAVLDMDLLMAREEFTVAVGNGGQNFRGDELGRGGEVVRRREDVLRDYYNSKAAEAATPKQRYVSPDSFETPAEVIARMEREKKAAIEAQTKNDTPEDFDPSDTNPAPKRSGRKLSDD